MENLTRKNFPNRPQIIFMGTPGFAVPGLKALVEQGHDILAVVTQPDRPKGRGRKIVPSPVKTFARACEIEVLQPKYASSPEFCEKIRNKGPDILIVVAFGQILKKALLEIPRIGALNIHASLLPKYRGAAPIQWAILNRESKTGLTAMWMDEGLDSGPILLQEEVSILPDETAGQLHDRLSALAGDFLLRTLDGLAEDQLKETPQDPAAATFAPKIDRGMASIKWDQPAEAVSALIRALDPWPGAFSTFRGKEIKLFSSRVADKGGIGLPGRVLGREKGLLEVATSEGVVEIGELQIPGKKRLPAREFLKGFSLEKGTFLGKPNERVA